MEAAVTDKMARDNTSQQRRRQAAPYLTCVRRVLRAGCQPAMTVGGNYARGTRRHGPFSISPKALNR